MNAPEDIAYEGYFTPPTLTGVLRSELAMEPQSNGDFNAQEDTLRCIRSVFKNWLRTVDIPERSSVEATRQLLITLVDEP
jgi:hypothetical protein